MSDRAAWLAERRTGIGSSDIAGILGLSPYTTPFQVWLSKMEELEEDTESEPMRWGRLLESLILDEWERTTGERTDRYGDRLIRSSDYPWLLASPDAMTADGIPIDAKVTSDWSWDEPPAHYRLQSLHQQIVVGADHGLIVALHAGRQLETYRVDRDETVAAEIIAASQEFWRLVESGEPPPVEAEDNALLARLWPTSTEQAVEIPEAVAWALWDADEAYRTAKTARDAAQATVKGLLREADTATLDQWVVATWKEGKSGRRFYVKDAPERDMR